MSIKIGPYQLSNHLFLAPMAGVTDQPFRILCRRLGAGMVVSEMITSALHLYSSQKTQHRLNHVGETSPISVQIAGSVPQQMAEAARFNIEQGGAQIIDINMGCPAKKVCHIAAGSALLRNETLVQQILQAVTAVCSPLQVPVTLKFRTGWSPDQRNACQIARIAEDQGIALLALHGRTRTDFYQGHAEYDTIAAVKTSVAIPVIANGDIDSPEKAQYVLQYTQADGIMIGRAAQGRPWIFGEIEHYLAHAHHQTPLSLTEKYRVIIEHLHRLHQFYGPHQGVRIARKHMGWYLNHLPQPIEDKNMFRKTFNALESPSQQQQAIDRYFAQYICIASQENLSPHMEKAV